MCRTGIRIAILCAIGLSSVAAAQDWPMYGQNPSRTFANDHGGANAITPQTAPLLVRRWFFPTLDAVTASPAVVDGTVYVGDWAGFFWALDARTGVPRWVFEVDCDPAVTPGTPSCVGEPGWDPVQGWPLSFPGRVMDDGGIITSSPAVVDVPVGSGTEKRVFFGGGKTLYALRAGDGSLAWKSVICGNREGLGRAPGYDCEADTTDHTRIFTSPLVVERSGLGQVVYVGTSVDGQRGYHGKVRAFDAVDGEILWTFDGVPMKEPNPQLCPNPDGLEGAVECWTGCDNVWSSMAIDTELDRIYFGVSDCHFWSNLPDFDGPQYSGRLLALDADTGDLELVMEPSLIHRGELPCDYAIGATPNVFDYEGEKLVGVGRKDGVYYLFERNAVAGDPETDRKPPLRELRAGPAGGVAGGFIGSTAVDTLRGKVLGATALGDAPGGCLSDPILPVSPQEPSVHGMNVDGSGNGDWHRYLNQSFGASAVANGVMYVGTHLLQDFRLFDVATGDLLTVLPMGASVHSGPAVVDGWVYVGSGNSEKYNGAGIHGFSLPTNVP